MQLNELLTKLSYGELSNLSLGSNGAGSIKITERPKVIDHVNDGLLKIYTRFSLLEKNVIIEQVTHITNYHLKSRYSESNQSDEPYLYIKDKMAEPFTEDVIKITEVFDSTGKVRPLNDRNNVNSVFTPLPDTLQVPRPVAGQALAILYQARHPLLEREGDNVLSQDIDLPIYLNNALQSYVAYKIFGNMNGQENLVISQTHLDAFNAACSEVIINDSVNNTFATSQTKLESRGFV